MAAIVGQVKARLAVPFGVNYLWDPVATVGLAVATGASFAREVFTGVYASTAILAALNVRHQTGQGQHIDMSLLDVAVAVTANQAMNYLTSGVAPGMMGNSHMNLTPYQVFDCADGYIIVASGNDGQYRQFCALLGLPELAVHPDYATNATRLNNRHALEKLLSAKTTQWTKLDLLAACEAHGVPAGPINDMSETFADPQVVHRGMQIDLDGVPSVRLPISFSDAESTARTPSPKLGQDQGLLD